MRWPFFSKLEIAIRSAKATDSDKIAELHREGGFFASWSAQEIESLMADRAVVTDTACDSRKSDQLYGFIMSRCAADEAEILTIAVRSKRRGKGIGRRLLEAHIPKLAQKGVKILGSRRR